MLIQAFGGKDKRKDGVLEAEWRGRRGRRREAMVSDWHTLLLPKQSTGNPARLNNKNKTFSVGVGAVPKA